MSDTSQGPGWWQASDDKWYPPESHPEYRAPDVAQNPPPPAGTIGLPTPPPAPPPEAQAPSGHGQPAPPSGAPLWTNPPPPADAGQHYMATQYAYAPAQPQKRSPWFWVFVSVAGLSAFVIFGAIAANILSGDEAASDTTTTIAEKDDDDVVVVTETTEVEKTAPETTEATTPPTTKPKPKPTDPPTTPVTAAPTTELVTTEPAPPTTAPDSVFTAEELQTIVFPVVFEASREEVLDVLEKNLLIESVDKYAYDPEKGDVQMEITPTYDFEDGARDDAWEFTSAMATLWTADGWVDPGTGWSPNFDLKVSTVQYRCTGNQMQKIESGEWRRKNWENKCRIS